MNDEEMEPMGIDIEGLSQAARTPEQRMLGDIRARVQKKWDNILQPDNLAQIPGTPAWRELHQGGPRQQRRAITAEEAQNIVGTRAYMEAQKPDARVSWGERMSEEVSQAADLVARAKGSEASINRTGQESAHESFQTTADEVAALLRSLNPNKYPDASSAYKQADTIALALNRGKDSTWDMFKDMVLARRNQQQPA